MSQPSRDSSSQSLLPELLDRLDRIAVALERVTGSQETVWPGDAPAYRWESEHEIGRAHV